MKKSTYTVIAVLLLVMAILIQVNARTEYRQGFRTLEAMERNYEGTKAFHYVVKEKAAGEPAAETNVWADPAKGRYRVVDQSGTVRVYRDQKVYEQKTGQKAEVSGWNGKAPSVGIDLVFGKLSRIEKLSLVREKKGGDVVLRGSLESAKWVVSINPDRYLPGTARVYDGDKLIRMYTFTYPGDAIPDSTFAPLE